MFTTSRNKPDCAAVDSFSIYVNAFCTCGYLMELSESGVTYCDNPLCSKRATAYRVVVNMMPVQEES